LEIADMKKSVIYRKMKRDGGKKRTFIKKCEEVFSGILTCGFKCDLICIR
jgi:hypothetical protein